ncbi:proteasome assembly chaperone family protein [Halosegnis longus]|uniref:proteasome assembly chaperone family protein n=1 Tax=Halosegnis longus TaxID=2216012 RepID=UPI00096A2AC7|nr:MULTISPECIES: PAC2 family protein [Halobacteriales]
MAEVEIHADATFDEPTLIEGLPGAGLVGKIAADHLVEELDLEWVGSCYCDGLPQVSVYRGESMETMPPVRIYGDDDRELLVLQSDVPVSPSQASAFTDCLVGWLESESVFPVFLSGLPEEKGEVPGVYGIATGDGADRLADTDVTPPEQGGLISGPTGALVHAANKRDLDGVALIAQSEVQFPDPEAARAVIRRAIEPLIGVDIETDTLVERAEEIRAARERLAQQVHEGDDESTKATAIRGFQ